MDAQSLEHQDVGGTISRLTQDVQFLCDTGIGQFFSFCGGILAIAMALLAAAFIHWSYLFIFPLTMALSLLAPRLFAPKFQKQAQILSACRNQFVSGIRDRFAGASTFKRNHVQEQYLKEMRTLSEQFETDTRAYNDRIALYQNTIQIFSVFAQILYVLSTLILIFVGVISIGSIVGVLNISQSIYTSISLVFGSLSTLSGISPILDQFHIPAQEPWGVDSARQTKTDALSENRSPINKDTALQRDPALTLQVDHLSLGYGEQTILRDLNLRFEAGKKYALVGTSGCGKSTLLKALLKELTPQQGRISLGGRDYEEISSAEIYDQIGLIQQDPYLLNRSIRDNITLGARFSEEQIQQALSRSALTNFVQNLPSGLDTLIENNGKNISGGQKQRMILAREYLRNKSILLMDEGTTSLDQDTKREIEQKLLQDPDLLLIAVCHPRSAEELAGFDTVITLGT